MTTDEMVVVLREAAKSDELSFGYARTLLNIAADRLEELDDQVENTEEARKYRVQTA